ncbi:Hypothetical predicted protein [Cloeon dipterum]|uniref:N-acetylgalactosaminide beta-1,3-galactosyltransferase n=1 Tax=Cloeon dipterum TaxID=197152 RepID=A0A8S1BV00_9INSE|nr:Hypothetical predicted protein [Cloeon dipterum]
MPLEYTAFHITGFFLSVLFIVLCWISKINSTTPCGLWKAVVSHGPRFFLTFLIGLCLGIFLPSLTFITINNPGNAILATKVAKSEHQELYESLSHWLQMNSTFAVDLLTETREIEARRLAERVRILCLVIDDPFQTQRRNGSKATWGRHCNKLIFTSEVTDRKKRVVEDYSSAWKSVVRALKFVYKKYIYDFEWLVRLDDETFLLVENLRRALEPFSIDDPNNYGVHFNTLNKPNTSTGYALSRQAVKKLVEEGFASNTLDCRNENATEVDDDLEITSCMKHLNLKPFKIDGETLPFDDKKFSLPLVRGKSWWKEEFEFWPYGKSPSPPRKRTSCCRRNLISFHQAWPQKMYLLEYLIYDVQVYGAPFHIISNEKDTRIFYN